MCLQCVSYSQRKTLPSEWRDVPVITNGVFMEAPAGFRVTKRNFALILGRICPEKNFHVAMDAGKEAGIPVWLGGQVYPYSEHELYFRQEISPRLHSGHRFLGPLNAARKWRLLAAAKCLLLPSLAPETSSLVAMEALSAGTPVIAFDSGALPEIIQDGVTGFLVENQQEMTKAIHHICEIHPQRCREEARKRFSQQRMIAEYLSLYTALIQQQKEQCAVR
jgi:glycosyltransferase involved in cell wall biosynthesis